MTANPFIMQYLMTAGPTPIPPAVSQAMSAPMLYHRAPAFDELYARVLERLTAVRGLANELERRVLFDRTRQPRPIALVPVHEKHANLPHLCLCLKQAPYLGRRSSGP